MMRRDINRCVKPVLIGVQVAPLSVERKVNCLNPGDPGVTASSGHLSASFRRAHHPLMLFRVLDQHPNILPHSRPCGIRLLQDCFVVVHPLYFLKEFRKS